MEYKNDKCEFTAFVKAGLDSKEQENIEICIERVTKTVKEDFLNARARLYKDEVKNDAEVMTAFRRLSVICNENVQQCYECPVSKYCNTYIDLVDHQNEHYILVYLTHNTDYIILYFYHH